MERMVFHRRNLHKIPEIGFDLPKTHAYLLDAIKGLRCTVEVVAETGLTLFFDAGKPRAVAFRSDMDALEIAEQTGAAYASTHGGNMHACGHDAHMAMLLALASYVDEHIAGLPHNVVLIFQPAEESGGGGIRIAQSGILERLSVKAIYALHVDPRLKVGQVASRPGAFMARASEVWARVRGRSAHVGRATEGIDATLAAAEFYRRAYQLERGLQSADPHLLKFGIFQSGSAMNILSGEATLGGTMRTYAQADFEALKAGLLKIARGVEAETGARIELSVADGYPAVINDAALFETARRALADMDFIELPEPCLLGEDFSGYLQHVPGLMLFVGVGGDQPLHSPRFDADERVLAEGYRVLTKLCAEDIR